MSANLENSAEATGLEKISFNSNPKERQFEKKYSNYCAITVISHASKFMLKIIQASLQQYMNWELPWTENFQMYKLGFEEAEESEIKLPMCTRSWRKQGSSRKIFTYVLFIMLKPLIVWIMTNCRSFFKRWEYQTTLPLSWETCRWVKKQQLESDIEQLIGWTLWMEYDQPYIVTLLI